ncbi:ATP-grasp domain-containing protein [Actinoplanes utahensis]|uniref:ATP-grasp domain-containing protein n=1 Tax=Actinoplanes utahensis TaxID=1869 RepID=A0A0A6XGU0_ACTUT|nr:hypothetical protein [Actinoplanes utahensis]KHD79292.1 hypothetical protein MB27_00180 [Actinoplanes utahensis]GIF34136.1 ATP-grasp domain-containing protein [Actinoplanes utahensis]
MGRDARIALVTSADLPDLWDDDHPLRDALRERGVTVEAVRWDDPAADWSGYDLAVIRSPWDYVARREEFVAWARTVPRLANPAAIVAWNTDKRYLRDLAAAGIPIIPTEFIGPGESWTPPSQGEWVVKPTISAGSQDTSRYRLPGDATLATAHVERLTGAGRTAMIQPYLSAVDTAGETAVLCTPDASGELTFSHGIRKAPMLTGPAGAPIDASSERITPRDPSPAEIEAAARVLAVIPGGAKQLLYARVDLIPGPDGTPTLIELELTEPCLFLRTAPGSADRLADAILARL